MNNIKKKGQEEHGEKQISSIYLFILIGVLFLISACSTTSTRNPAQRYPVQPQNCSCPTLYHNHYLEKKSIFVPKTVVNKGKKINVELNMLPKNTGDIKCSLTLFDGYDMVIIHKEFDYVNEMPISIPKEAESGKYEYKILCSLVFDSYGKRGYFEVK